MSDLAGRSLSESALARLESAQAEQARPVADNVAALADRRR